MAIEGKVWRYGDNIDTDVIIPARYLNTFDPKELASHCMVDIDETFAKEVQAGDIMVGGRNFGCGSSREHAPIAIKASGIPVIVAASFARIFYRNGINVGLPLLEIGDDVEKIHAGDRLRIDLSTGRIEDLTTGDTFQAPPLPGFIQDIARAGGLVNYVKEKKRNDKEDHGHPRRRHRPGNHRRGRSRTEKIDEVCSIGLEFTWKDAGGTAYDKYGTPLPEDTVETAKASDAVLFGAVGGDQWDHFAPDLRPERAILGLRKALGLYVNLRPVKVMDVLAEYSPLKEELAKGTDLLIVRELIGGIYFGDKCESEIHNGVERAWDLENYSIPEVERITRFAMTAARKRRSKVTSVDKSNVLATSRLWRRTVTKLAEEYPDVAVDHLYVDNCAMQLAIHPTQFDVIVTSNLFGDILSDEAAVLSGSIGMLLRLHRREHQPL